MQDAVTSPLPEETKTMTFPEAIKEVMIGKRIQRQEWHDSEYAMVKNIDGDEYLIIHRNEKDSVWLLRLVDLQADDYVSF